jgi:glycosyltransferase involved in cell wall biosynthesis
VRILVVTSSYPLYPGDSTAPFVESIVRSVAKLGHDVHVLVPEQRGWKWPAVERRVRYHRFRYSPARSWTPWGFSASLAGGTRIKAPLFALAPVVLASAVRSARSLLAGGEFDLVHVHWVVPNGPIGALAVRGGTLPLVVSLHGSDVALAERSHAVGRIAKWSFARCAAVTAPSAELLGRARALGAPDRLELVPYGADAVAVAPAEAHAVRERLGFAPEDIVVAGIGRLIRLKGFEHLVDAHARAIAEEPRLRLVLVGDGDLRSELEARARALGVADSVILAGAVERRVVPAYLEAADLVAVPSVHHDGYVDGLPNVALEALAAGKPLVATNVGGLPELVRPGENGLLVEERDAEALARAILELARDPELRARLGAAGQAEIREERSWRKVGERFVEIYESIVPR